MTACATDTNTSDELVYAADQLYGLGNAIKLEFLRALDRIEENGAWEDDGATSFERWVAYRYAMLPDVAFANIRAMRALRHLPRIAEAFARGSFPEESLFELCSFVVPSEDEKWAERASRVSPATLQLDARRARRIKREEAAEAQRDRYLVMWNEKNGMGRGAWKLPPAEHAALKNAIERIVARYNLNPSPLPEPYAAKAADALVELGKFRVASDADIDRSNVVIHVSAKDLNSLHGSAMFDDGTAVSSEVARRLSCDGRLQAVTYDDAGDPLNLGRRSRVASPAQIRALKKLQGAWCATCGGTVGLEAHHIIHWAHGGRTDLDNLILVCWRCHCLLHDKRFRLRRLDSGEIQLLRPDGRPVMDRPIPLRPHIRERMLGPPDQVA